MPIVVERCGRKPFRFSLPDAPNQPEPVLALGASCNGEGHAEDIIRDLTDSENASGRNGQSDFSVSQTLGGALRPLCISPVCEV
jgi:hypothetical protein